MANIFYEVEDNLFSNEEIIFDENKIKDYMLSFIYNHLNSFEEKEKPFAFENIVYDFFIYMKIPLVKTKKTRDLGIDGIIKLNLNLLGEINLGLQIKNKLIDSNDIDLFLSALKNSELQLGVMICKDSRRLDKYELNSKIRAILLSKGILLRERLIKENININPVFILKLEDIIEIVSSEMRSAIRAIYKK
ncbi:MAG: restriction endonuclease [Nanoarchaeota archaeon]